MTKSCVLKLNLKYLQTKTFITA